MSTSSNIFAIPNIRYYLSARFCTVLAQDAMVVIIGWQVYDIARQTMTTKDAAFQLGLVGVAQFAPLLLLTLVAGWAADHLDRRWIARGSLALQLSCAIALGLLAHYHATTLPMLFLIAAMLGVARAFSGPALQALSPNLVPPALLPRMIATSSMAWQTGAIMGPALGGYLYAIGDTLPFEVSAALFAIALIAMMFIGPVARQTHSDTLSPFRRMIDGLRYVRHNRLVLGAISLDLFAVLLGGATAMLPIYARDILHVGPQGLGHLRAAPAVGASITALLLSIRPLRTNVGPIMLAGVAVFGLATMVFGLSHSMPLSLLCLFVMGIGDMVSVFVRQSLVQIYTPDAMRGRVAAVSTLFISGSNELGEAESGLLASLIGPVSAVILGGAGAVCVTVLWSRWFPELRKARTFDPPANLEKLSVQETTR